MEKSRRVYGFLAIVILAIAVVLVYQVASPAPLITGPGPINIEVATDKQSYLPGEEIKFHIYVYNSRFWQVPYPFRVEYRIGDGALVKQITLPIPPPTFHQWSRILYDTYVWDQKTGSGGNRTQVLPGDYTLTVSFDGIIDYGNDGSCTIDVLPAP